MAKKKKVQKEEAPELVFGISLAQYAAVNAALAEGLSLSEVLEIEGLDARSYPKADIQWKQRLVAAASLTGGLFEQYQKELSDAEDWLSRSIVPLESNPLAWTAFLQAYSSSPDPGAWLKSLKLGPNDVSRLSRAWAKRADKDPALAKQLGELSKSPSGVLPALSLGPIARKRSRAAGGAGGSVIKDEPSKGGASSVESRLEEIGLDRWAAIQADLAAFPELRQRVLLKYGLTDPGLFNALSERWTAQLAKDPELNRDYRTLFSHYSNQARREGPASVMEPKPAPAAPVSPPAEEARFIFAPRPDVIEAPALRGVVAAPEPKAKSDATQDVSALFATGAPLPFQQAASVPAQEGVQKAEKPVHIASGTQDVSAFFQSEASLPFGDRSSGPPPEPKAEPQKPVQQAAGTQDVSALFSTGAALPFGDRPSSLPAEPEKPKAPAAVHQASGTQDVGALFQTGAALPFGPQEPMKPSPSRPELPNLSLEQYASLCVELHLAPDRSDEIFRRYGIPQDVRASVDAYWQRRLSAEPPLYQAYAQAYNAYKTWLLQNRRR